LLVSAAQRRVSENSGDTSSGVERTPGMSTQPLHPVATQQPRTRSCTKHLNNNGRGVDRGWDCSGTHHATSSERRDRAVVRALSSCDPMFNLRRFFTSAHHVGFLDHPSFGACFTYLQGWEIPREEKCSGSRHISTACRLSRRHPRTVLCRILCLTRHARQEETF